MAGKRYLGSSLWILKKDLTHCSKSYLLTFIERLIKVLMFPLLVHESRLNTLLQLSKDPKTMHH